VEKNGLQKVSQKTKVPYDSLRKMKNMKICDSPVKRRGKPVKYPDLEAAVKLWILNQRLKGKKITVKTVMEHAKKIATQRQISSLNFSMGWFTKFKERNGFSLRKPTSNMTKPRDQLIIKAQEYIESIKLLISKK